MEGALDADGFAVTFDYNGVLLSDEKLEPVWAVLDSRRAVVFAPPHAYAGGTLGRPCVLLEVAFETARVVVDMVYRGVFRRHPNVRFVVAHCGGALPALSGRLALIGLESWVPNPEGITPEEFSGHLARLFVDTAATMPTALAPALAMTGLEHIVYGSDCGVPCSSDETLDANIRALRERTGLTAEQVEFIGRNALSLFPKAARRLRRGYVDCERRRGPGRPPWPGGGRLRRLPGHPLWAAARLTRALRPAGASRLLVRRPLRAHVRARFAAGQPGE